MSRAPIILMIVWICLTGCSTVNDRRQGSGVCELHLVKMATYSLKERHSKIIDATLERLEAEKRLFPNCPPLGGPRARWYAPKLILYGCEDCREAYYKWSQGQMDKVKWSW